MAKPRRRRWESLAVLIAMLAVLSFPNLAFPHPMTNDAIGLSDAEWPLLLLEVAGAVTVYAVFRGWRGAVIRAGVGVFLFGAAISLVVGLLVFGNASNDRFAPLLLFPPVFGLVGLAGIVVAVAAGVQFRRDLVRGAGYGLAFAFAFGSWSLVRGARAWLLAPYGFDLILLIGVLGVGLVVLGTSPNLKKSAAPGRPKRSSDG